MDSSLQIPGYSIKAEIGKGGMATVYVAIQESLARTVALKLMSSQSMADPSAEERFLKEGKIVARLNHPNIVTVYDIGRVDAVYYMAMEFIEGGNLNDRIREGLTVADTYHIARQIAKALAYAHNRGFVHRDVKPANILFKEDGTAVLSDFGIAKAISSETHLTGIGQTIGTPDYMSPEQVKGEPLDSRSDLYSLGIVIYEMLTGEKPFRSDSVMGVVMKHIVAAPPQLPEHLQVYQSLLDRLLAKEPGERFSTAEQLIHALDDLFGDIIQSDASATVLVGQSSGPVDRLSTKKTSLDSMVSTRPNMVFAVLLVVLLIAAGAGIYYWQSEIRPDPQTRMIIDVLLTQAELQMKDSNLVEPPGVNAHRYYRNVLELDPGNKKALEGIEKIADHFEDHARGKQQAGKYDEALASVEQGLEVKPQHEALSALREELTAQRDEQHRRRRVSALLEQANRQIAAGSLLAPPGDNAHESYRSILELDRWNKQALKGLWEIADGVEKQAKAKQQQGLLDEALVLAAKGLQIDPQHQGLTKLRDSLNRQITGVQNRQRITQLLKQAQRQLDASRLTQPVGDNALESFREVQKLDPNNKEALSGLQELANRIEKKAIAARKQDLMDQALALIELGLQVAPGHSGLLEQHKEVNEQFEHTREQRKITRLLAEAERQIKASQRLAPEGDNAYASYREVLALDPDNRAARAGLARIASHFEELARKHRGKGELAQSLIALEQGLRVLPGDADLEALRSQVKMQLGELQSRLQEVRRLLLEAQRQTKASRWTEPVNDNAYASYRKVLELEPGNNEAQAGITQIAAHFEALARQRRDEGALRESLEAVEQGLKVQPRYAGLQALRSQLRDQIAQLERRQREVQRLLAKAERQFKSARWTEPEADNAYTSYRKVLELDPGNAAAQSGLEQIAERFEVLTRRHLDEGALQDGLVTAERGLKVLPDHRGLLALRAQLQRLELGRVEQQRRREREIRQLLEQAKRQRADSRLAQPDGNNALQTFQAVLALDPNNREALAGLEAIADYYENVSDRAASEGRLQDALNAITLGLKAVPDQARLSALQKDVSRQLREKVSTKRRVSELLAAAQTHLAASRYTQPEGNNAYASYREALALSPNEPQALAGIEEIADRLLKRGRKELEQGALKESLATTEQGLLAAPVHTALLALREDVTRRLEKQQGNKVLNDWLARAERQLADFKLTRPRGDSAYDSFQQALKISPQEKRALTGLQRIADRYLELGLAEFEKGALPVSLAMIERGLGVVPNHAGLLTLKSEVQQKAESRHEELQNLLILARQQVQAGRLIQSEGDDARDTYLKILKIDPRNQEAKKGLRQIAAHYETLAKTNYDSGAFQEALTMVDSGLKADPNHKGLTSLQKQILSLLGETEDLNRKLVELLEDAKQKLEAGQFTQPKGDNAFEIYQEVLRLEPENSLALEGLYSMARHFEVMAREKQRQGDLARSLGDVEEGLKVLPNHSGLLSLKDSLDRQIRIDRANRRLFGSGVSF